MTNQNNKVDRAIKAGNNAPVATRRRLVLASLALSIANQGAWAGGDSRPVADGAAKGYMVISLTRTGFIKYMRTIALDLRNTSGEDAAKIRSDIRSGLPGSEAPGSRQADFVSSDAPWGELKILELPAGAYTMGFGSIFSGKPSENLPLAFEIVASELHYLGNFNAHFLFGNVAKLSHTDKQGRDLRLLFELRPELRDLPRHRNHAGTEA